MFLAVRVVLLLDILSVTSNTRVVSIFQRVTFDVKIFVKLCAARIFRSIGEILAVKNNI